MQATTSEMQAWEENKYPMKFSEIGWGIKLIFIREDVKIIGAMTTPDWRTVGSDLEPWTKTQPALPQREAAVTA